MTLLKSNKSLRLFVGFSLERLQKNQLIELQKYLSPKLNQEAVPVIADNLHMTLVFLGNVEPQQIEIIKQAINQIPKHKFEQSLLTLAYWSGPKIMCITGQATQPLLNMATKVQSLASTLNLHCSQFDYQPHITLFRHVRQADLTQVPPITICLSSTKLHLYHSESTPLGVRYHIIDSWELSEK